MVRILIRIAGVRPFWWSPDAFHIAAATDPPQSLIAHHRFLNASPVYQFSQDADTGPGRFQPAPSDFTPRWRVRRRASRWSLMPPLALWCSQCIPLAAGRSQWLDFDTTDRGPDALSFIYSSKAVLLFRARVISTNPSFSFTTSWPLAFRTLRGVCSLPFGWFN